MNSRGRLPEVGSEAADGVEEEDREEAVRQEVGEEEVGCDNTLQAGITGLLKLCLVVYLCRECKTCFSQQSRAMEVCEDMILENRIADTFLHCSTRHH